MILNKKRIEIDEIELQILKLFNSLNPLSIIQIINLFEFKEITYSQKLRLKDKVLSDLNTKIKLLCELKRDPIEKQKDLKDSRLRVYNLNVPIVHV